MSTVSSADALQAAIDALIGQNGAHAAGKGKAKGNDKDKAEPFRDLLKSLSRAQTPAGHGREGVKVAQAKPGQPAEADTLRPVPETELDADGVDHVEGADATAEPQAPAPTTTGAEARAIDWLGLPSQAGDAPMPKPVAPGQAALPDAEPAITPGMPSKSSDAPLRLTARPIAMEADVMAMPSEALEPEQSLSLALARAVTSSAEMPTGPAKVVVLQQETHFQPVPELAPVQKIADVVISEMEGAFDMASLRAADLAAPEPGSKPSEPLKVLTIRLDPPELGTVTVKLRLVGDVVQVEMAASRHETAQILQQQRELLSDIMRQAGYSSSVASVQHGGPDAVLTVSHQSGHMQAPTGQHQQQAQSFGFGGDGGGSAEFQDGGGRQDQQDRRPFEQNEDRHHDRDPGRAGSALYL